MARQFINLISDTVTKPTPEMLRAMMDADVGDDVFGQDPTVNELQARLADMFGKESAVFCPSGTMTNQIAIKAHTRPLEEIICDKYSHIYLYEIGGYGFNSGAAINLIDGTDGKMSADQIRKAIKPDTEWYPTSRLVVIENSCNRAGGTYYTLPEIKEIRKVCTTNRLKMHLDGARLFNVLVETGESTRDYGAEFDSISICLSKGLGAPVGSVLIGDADFIRRARKIRKVFGGGMRQAGYLAAAGIYALDNHVDRLKIDNRRAEEIGAELSDLPYIEKVLPVKTNIIIFRPAPPLTPDLLLKTLEEHGILATFMDKETVRFVFHLDISEQQIAHLRNTLQILAEKLR